VLRLRNVVALSLAVCLFGLAATADAYCRKTTCKTCEPDPLTGCPTGGIPIQWSGACVGYALEAALPRQVTLATAEVLVAQAFGAWQAVQCPGTGRHPSIIASSVGLVQCNRHEYDRSEGNANVILFREDGWPHPGVEDALGLTATTFNDETGEILDADMEINGMVPLSASDPVNPDATDLLSILTHEVGHFLGLAHSTAPDATMQPIYGQGTSDWRTLSQDDIDGICAVYPPDRSAEPCTFVPHGGFASECALGVLQGGCGIARPPPRTDETGTLVAYSLACGSLLGRRRRLRRPKPKKKRW